MSSDSKRVWRIVHSESSPEYGGEERRILAELTGFQRRGSVVALLALRRSWIFQRASELGIAVQAFSSSRWFYPWAIAQCALWLRRFRPDVLNTHSSRDAWIAGIAGRWAGVPFIVRTRHFDVPLRHRRVSRIVYESLSDHLITTSPKVTALFQEIFQWPPDRVSTLPTGVDTALFCRQGTKPDFAIRGGAAGLPRIGMVGVLRGAKGHDVFLHAIQLLHEAGFAARYYIIGEGPMRPGIEQQVREQQLGACVTLTGHREDVPEMLRGFDLLVIPSRHEGVPQVGLQALASETPVVASDVGGIPGIIQPGKTGRLVPVGDPSALARAIREALGDRKTTERMAQEGRALIERQYSLEAMLDSLEALYRRGAPSRP